VELNRIEGELVEVDDEVEEAKIGGGETFDEEEPVVKGESRFWSVVGTRLERKEGSVGLKNLGDKLSSQAFRPMESRRQA